MEDEFPADIIDILVDSAYNEDDVYGYKADSDIEDWTVSGEGLDILKVEISRLCLVLLILFNDLFVFSV